MTVKPLDPDTIRVRWLAIDPDDGTHRSRWRDMLDTEERQQADRFRFSVDRDTFTAAHALTRAMLTEATGRPTNSWRFVKGQFGKPALIASGTTADRLHFNISHTRGFVACAIADREIGVDVEAADRPIDLDIADRFFAPEEVRLLKSAPADGRMQLFFRFWTLKETFIKATGEGLNRRLDSFSFRLDPVQIVFHPERESTPHRDDPTAWRFAEYQPAWDRPVAVAVHWTASRPPRWDAGPSRPEEIVSS